MVKALAIIDLESDLKAIMDQIRIIDECYAQKYAFIRKQVEDTRKEHNKELKAPWDEVEKFFLDRGRLPKEYNHQTHHMHYEPEGGLLYLCDGNHDLPQALVEFVK